MAVLLELVYLILEVLESLLVLSHRSRSDYAFPLRITVSEQDYGRVAMLLQHMLDETACFARGPLFQSPLHLAGPVCRNKHLRSGLVTKSMSCDYSETSTYAYRNDGEDLL